MPGNPAGLLDGSAPRSRNNDELFRDGYRPGEPTGPLRLNASGDLCGITFSEPGPGVWSSRGKSPLQEYRSSPFLGRFKNTRLAGGTKEG